MIVHGNRAVPPPPPLTKVVIEMTPTEAEAMRTFLDDAYDRSYGDRAFKGMSRAAIGGLSRQLGEIFAGCTTSSQ